MFDVAGEHNRLADLAAIVDANAAFHQIAKDLAVGRFVVDRLVDTFLLVLKIGRKDAVFFKLIFLFIVQLVVLDAVTQELGRKRDHFKRIQESRVVFDRFTKFIAGSRVLPFTLKHVECAFANKLNWRCRQTDLVAVEILKQLLVPIVQTSMRFISDDQIKEPYVK